MLRIGSLELLSRVMLAPMAGVCDGAFRRVVRRFDPHSLLSTEIVNCDALLAGDREMLERIRLHPDESPAALQISGHEALPLARAALLAQEAGADLIDINCGCPSPALVRSGNGAALLRNPSSLAPLFEAVRKAIRVPLTVKMRLGWDESCLTGREIARIAQECGADAVWIHGRTARQQYQGEADWDAISAIKADLRIPVFGNGDVFTPQEAKRRFSESRVDAIAIARGAMGNPWIFQRTNHYLKTGELLSEPSMLERIETARLQCQYLIEAIGERRGVSECRKHVAWYVRGLPGTSELKQRVNAAGSLAEIESALESYLAGQPDVTLVSQACHEGTLIDAKWRRYR